MDVQVIDGSRFHESQFRSSEITHAFTSALRVVLQGPQSEVPHEVALEPDAPVSEAEIVRGVDDDR